MSINHEALGSVLTLGELDTLLQSEGWEAYLQSLAKRLVEEGVENSDASRDVAQLRSAIDQAQTRMSPEHSNWELQSLKSKVYDNPTADPEKVRPLLVRIAAIRSKLPTRQYERLFGQLQGRVGQLFSAQNVGTGYSNRARRAKDLFTEHAGRTKIEGAATDRYGNAEGTGYDLGRDGAFEGHTVHVLQLYGFDFSNPRKAFERKGFQVDLRTQPGTPSALQEWLSDAHQLWFISDSSRKLKDEHIEVIQQFWARGGALYIWGDNDPYYADANALLATLFGPKLKMYGNLHGMQVVHEFHDQAGFHPHLITTGLVHLFEGATVASLDASVAEQYGFMPLMYGSAKNLITAVREPTPTSGAMVIDAAFTRLYCQWDDAGSARFVCNAGCFLAAMTLPEDAAESESSSSSSESKKAPVEEEPERLPYDIAGALVGECDLTGEWPGTWVVMSVAQMGDALRNTTDMVLTDPLCAGAWNCIFSDALYSEQMGQWILGQPEEQRLDPLTRKPVVAVLPLIDLSTEKNLRAFTLVLCKTLMGGKYLPTPARLLFFAVVERMLEGDTKHPEAWRYLYRQCLEHFMSTPDFTEIGRKMPLLDAMTALFSSATPELVQLRRTFATVGVIGRTLLREGKATREQIRLIARRALLVSVARDALSTEKATPGKVSEELMGLLYDNFHGIPKLMGARLVKTRPSFVHDRWEDESRTESALGGTPLLTAEEYTAALHALLSYDLRQFSSESLTERLIADSPAFAAIFQGKAAGDVLSTLNARFAPYQQSEHPNIDWKDLHLAGVPPFATTLGPSVYRCICGASFGDPKDPIDEQSLLALRTARTQHFREVYRVESTSDTWYPSQGTLHYNLHRAVQQVVKNQFTEATEVSEAMIPAIAAYLRDDAKGFVCVPTLPDEIRRALESYLDLRRQGQPHPDGLLTLELKARREQEMLLGRG